MRINDIWNLSSYRINEIPRVSYNNEQLPQGKEEEKPISVAQSSVSQDEFDRPRYANLDEVSLSFNKNEDYSNIGKDRDIELLDMQQAISDMRQDTILQDYRYFVGPSSTIFASEDGVVIAK